MAMNFDQDFTFTLTLTLRVKIASSNSLKPIGAASVKQTFKFQSEITNATLILENLFQL